MSDGVARAGSGAIHWPSGWEAADGVLARGGPADSERVFFSISVGGQGRRGRLAAGGDAGAGVPTLSTTGEVAVAVLRLTLSPGKRPEAPKHSPGPHLGWVRRGSGSTRPARGGRIPAETSRSLSPSRPRQAGVPADGDGLRVKVGGVVVVGGGEQAHHHLAALHEVEGVTRLPLPAGAVGRR